MAEFEDYLAREQKKMLQRQQGAGTERSGTLGYSHQWEVAAMSMPAYGNYQTLRQDPDTGLFLTRPGIDGEPADPLGRE